MDALFEEAAILPKAPQQAFGGTVCLKIRRPFKNHLKTGRRDGGRVGLNSQACTNRRQDVAVIGIG